MASDKHFFNPTGVRAPFGRYHHGVSFSCSPDDRWLFSSGQLGISPDDEVPESATDQARLCFEALGHILAEAEMSFSDVVKLTAYVTDRDYFSEYMQVRDEYVISPEPVSTLLIVSGFTRPEFKVEVEMTAIKRVQAT